MGHAMLDLKLMECPVVSDKDKDCKERKTDFEMNRQIYHFNIADFKFGFLCEIEAPSETDSWFQVCIRLE